MVPKQEPGATSSSTSRRKNGNKKKKESQVPQTTKFVGGSSDFEGKVFALKNELGSSNHARFMETIAQAEIYAASKFPK